MFVDNLAEFVGTDSTNTIRRVCVRIRKVLRDPRHIATDRAIYNPNPAGGRANYSPQNLSARDAF